MGKKHKNKVRVLPAAILVATGAFTLSKKFSFSLR